MITGLQLVTDAMYGSGALGQDEAITAADSQLCLRRLNRLMDSWSNFRSRCYQVQTDSFLMTANVASYSSTLLLNMGRPLNVDSMYVRLQNIDWTVEMISAADWAAIVYKPVPSIPNYCYLDTGFPDATFNFYPVPYAAFTCFVNSTTSLPADITLSTNIALPPGYERAIVDCLSIDICPSFGVQPSPTLIMSARQGTEALARTNLYVPELTTMLDYGQPDPSNGFIYKGF